MSSGSRTPNARPVPHTSQVGRFAAHVGQGPDGQATLRIVPHPDDPDPTELVHGVGESFSSPVRVARPAVRRSWLRAHRAGQSADSAGRRNDLRGREPFVQIDWEEALDLVAGELDRVRTDHGNAAIFGGSYGWASAGRFHHAGTQLHRFLKSIGGFTDQIGNYSYGAGMALLPHVLGSAASTDGDVTSWDVIAEHTELFVGFGGFPLKNAQVSSGGTSRHTAGRWLERVAASGTRFVSISPLRDDTRESFAARWLAPRPGTDVALMLALTHTLVAEGLADEDFLARHCVGWDRCLAYLEGREDGIRKSARWAQNITGIGADAIRALAREMAAHRTMINCTWSLQRADHGEQAYWAVILLAAALGQIGLPGGGFGFGYGLSATIGQPPYRFATPGLPEGANPVTQADPLAAIPAARFVDMLLHPGEAYEFDGTHRTYPDARLVYWAGGNPFHHHQDLNRMLTAWARPQTIVVHEPWWTATARHADIVLPASTTLERNDIAATSREPSLVAMKRAAAPRGQARSEFAIFTDLADRLGAREGFTEGRDELDWLAHLYEGTRASAAAEGFALPPFAQFWEDGGAVVPVRSEVMLADFREDPAAHPLATPSGLIELFSATIDSFGYDDCPGHPTWLEPAEWLGAPLARRYPLHLLSNQPAHRLHSQADGARASRAAKVAGREPCRLNPADAPRGGVADGDVVRIFNDRGSCLAGVTVSDALRPGVVQLSTGAWYQADAGGLEVHGNPNVLTRDAGSSRLGQGAAAQSALVQVERWEGPAPAVTVTRLPPRFAV